MKKLFIALALSLLINDSIFAQQSEGQYWEKINESSIKITGKRQIVPNKYVCFSLQSLDFKNKLFSAPLETQTKINQSSCIISLPLPDGTFQRFRVVEAPIMAESLDAAYPDLKTFSVKGIDDPYANGKLDWTEFGFHGMILSINGDFFIDPYCIGNTVDYISYFTTDFAKPASDVMLETGVIGAKENGEQKPIKSGANNNAKTNAAPCVGANLKTYRLAVACTGEYAVAATGLGAPTVAQTLAKIVTTVNRVNSVYEKELSIRLVLVASQTLIVFTNGASDPFNGNNNANTLINESQSVITATIGAANFDIGHTFSTGAGGLANLGCVCQPGNKAKGITGSPSPVGDPYDIDYVAHEMGHQFGGNHTFNCGTGSCAGNRNPATSVEPGSGVTVMAYAGICGSIDNLANNSIAYFHAISYDEIVNYSNFSTGNTCASNSASGNQAPFVNSLASYFIPKSTPFILTGSATDPDGDVLTYSWEETDPGLSTGSWNNGSRPYFRSYIPTSNPARLFPNITVVNSGNYTGTRGEYLPSTAQTLNFRLTARDNKMGGGGVCHANTSIEIDAAGPFSVTYPNSAGETWYSSYADSVKWDVNGTDQAPISCDSVRILISNNSGSTYSVLVPSTPNDGFQVVTVPTVPNTISTCRIRIEAKDNVFYDIGNNVFTISTGTPNINTAGVSKISKENNLGASIWPNPFKNSIYIHANKLNSKTNTSVIVSNILGEIVLKNLYDNKSELNEEIDLSNLNSGVYFIKLSNNNQYSTFKIVKD